MFIAAYAQDATKTLYEAAMATTDRQAASSTDAHGCACATESQGAMDIAAQADGAAEVCGQWEQEQR